MEINNMISANLFFVVMKKGHVIFSKCGK